MALLAEQYLPLVQILAGLTRRVVATAQLLRGESEIEDLHTRLVATFGPGDQS